MSYGFKRAVSDNIPMVQAPKFSAPAVSTALRAALNEAREAGRQLDHAQADGTVSFEEYSRRKDYLAFAEEYLNAALSGFID